MNKTGKWRILSLTVLLCASCSNWGQMDPPAGNQVYPKLERISSYTFNELDDAFQLSTYPDGDLPDLESDEEHGSVLHLNGGYVEINNPLNAAKIQNGVSLTFWFKQLAPEEGEKQDLQGAIFAFGNENAAQRVFFTANGWLNYDGPDGTYEHNNPASVETGILSPAGEWHYVALSVTNTGYFVFVDGVEKINHTETGFDCSKIVQFMASAPKLYIGYGSGAQPKEMWIDDLNIYRNQITNVQTEVPVTNGGGEETNYIIVGEEDCSTGWWSAFSDFITITGNQTMHMGFYNHTNGNENWNNWVIVVTNGKNRGEAGYAEYFVLRADAWGWGDGNHSNDNISHNYNWGSFKTDMKDAYVDLTVKRTDNRIDLTAVTTTTEKTVYTMTYSYEGNLEGAIGAFLTCEGACLEIDPETVYVGQSYSAGSYTVGPPDLTAPFWAHFSDFIAINGNTPYPFVHAFINHTNEGANWNNWLLVVTNGKNRGEDGYAEYFVLRADAWGWGDGNFVLNNISNSFDWNTFRSDMNGAYCMVILTRSANRIDVTAKVKTAAGVKLGDYTFFYEGVSTTDIGLFLLVEGASLDMRTVGYYPFLK